jgi:uncharacterized repeat protein (TIGR02543 family)
MLLFAAFPLSAFALGKAEAKEQGTGVPLDRKLKGTAVSLNEDVVQTLSNYDAMLYWDAPALIGQAFYFEVEGINQNLFRGTFEGQISVDPDYYIDENGNDKDFFIDDWATGYTAYSYWTPRSGSNTIKVNVDAWSWTMSGGGRWVYLGWGWIDFVVPAYYRVNLNANGGAYRVPGHLLPGQHVSALGDVSRPGYTFQGWFTHTSGGTKPATVTNHTTLHAQWKAKTYTVKMNANGGKGLTKKQASKKVTYDKKYGKLATPKRAGWKFKGWYTKKKGGTKITAKSTVRITKNTTLYAQWKK